MCIICTQNYEEYKNITKLDCHGCSSLVEIPVLPLLKELDCANCFSLTEIPVLPSLRELYCSNCSSLIIIPVLPRLKELYCNNCPYLLRIPVLPLIKKIGCCSCISLTEIPVLPLLKELYCKGCKGLYKTHPLAQEVTERIVQKNKKFLFEALLIGKPTRGSAVYNLVHNSAYERLLWGMISEYF